MFTGATGLCGMINLLDIRPDRQTDLISAEHVAILFLLACRTTHRYIPLSTALSE